MTREDAAYRRLDRAIQSYGTTCVAWAMKMPVDGRTRIEDVHRAVTAYKRAVLAAAKERA